MKHNAHAIFDSMHDYFEGIERARAVREKAHDSFSRTDEPRAGDPGRSSGARASLAEAARNQRRSIASASESGRPIGASTGSSVPAQWDHS
jgi:hypothetical protein